MRILIDAHMVGEHETGNETYVVNLIRGLQALRPEADFLVATTSEALLYEQMSRQERFRFVRVSAAPCKRLLWELPHIIKQENIDLLHVTYTAPLAVSCRLVVSVHDVAYRHNPAWFSLRDRLVLEAGIGISVRRADRVLAISNHANSEIRELYGLPQEKVTTIYLAAAEHFGAPPDIEEWEGFARHGISRPYILAVGNLQPRKNLPRLIDAFARLRQECEFPHKLVLIGKSLWKEGEVFASIRAAGLTDEVVCTGYVADADLPYLYAGADCFVYPSLYEGFGLPVLEAMACGTPVVTSNTSSLPEVAGESAFLVNPESVPAIADGIQRLLSDKYLARTMREKGLENVRRFSWHRTAEQTMDVYREALANVSVGCISTTGQKKHNILTHS